MGLSHGVVMETGGLSTQDRTAVEELNKVPIKHNAIVNPETHEEEQRVTQGFFHHHWNMANDVKSFQELSLKKLLKKVCELQEELGIAQAEVRRKTYERLPPRLLLERAVIVTSGEWISSRRIAQLSRRSGVEVDSDSTDDTALPSSSASTISEAPRGGVVPVPAPLPWKRLASV